MKNFKKRSFAIVLAMVMILTTVFCASAKEIRSSYFRLSKVPDDITTDSYVNVKVKDCLFSVKLNKSIGTAAVVYTDKKTNKNTTLVTEKTKINEYDKYLQSTASTNKVYKNNLFGEAYEVAGLQIGNDKKQNCVSIFVACGTLTDGNNKYGIVQLRCNVKKKSVKLVKRYYLYYLKNKNINDYNAHRISIYKAGTNSKNVSIVVRNGGVTMYKFNLKPINSSSKGIQKIELSNRFYNYSAYEGMAVDDNYSYSIKTQKESKDSKAHVKNHKDSKAHVKNHKDSKAHVKNYIIYRTSLKKGPDGKFKTEPLKCTGKDVDKGNNCFTNKLLGHANDVACYKIDKNSLYLFVACGQTSDSKNNYNFVQLKLNNTTRKISFVKGYKLKPTNYSGGVFNVSGFAIRKTKDNITPSGNVTVYIKNGTSPSTTLSTLYKFSLSSKEIKSTKDINKSINQRCSLATGQYYNYNIQGIEAYEDTLYVPMTKDNVSNILKYKISSMKFAKSNFKTISATGDVIKYNSSYDKFEVEGCSIGYRYKDNGQKDTKKVLYINANRNDVETASCNYNITRIKDSNKKIKGAKIYYNGKTELKVKSIYSKYIDANGNCFDNYVLGNASDIISTTPEDSKSTYATLFVACGRIKAKNRERLNPYDVVQLRVNKKDNTVEFIKGFTFTAADDKNYTIDKFTVKADSKEKVADFVVNNDSISCHKANVNIDYNKSSKAIDVKMGKAYNFEFRKYAKKRLSNDMIGYVTGSDNRKPIL